MTDRMKKMLRRRNIHEHQANRGRKSYRKLKKEEAPERQVLVNF
jgi:hypothetical protein